MTPTEVIHQELSLWAPIFVQNRLDAARQAGLVASRELLRSMRSEVTDALRDVQSFYFAMEGYGRILDMRRRRQGRIPPIEEIIDWIRDVGISKFRPGFVRRRGSVPASNQQLLNQIAWGVAKKAVSKKRRKRRRWYAKDKESDIDDLYTRLMSALQEETLRDQKDALS